MKFITITYNHVTCTEFLKKIIIIIIFLSTHIVLGNINISDKLIALVNHDIILDSDVKTKMRILSYYEPDINQRTSQYNISYQFALNQLIINHLILQAAKQEKIYPDCITTDNYTIDNIAQLRNMTTNEFRTHLHKIGINYQQYCSQLHQEILKKNICKNMIHQRAHFHVSPNEIDKLTSKLNNINFNKQYKLTHIIFSLPIQPTINQINKTKNLAQLLINTQQFPTNIKKLIHRYSNQDIFQTITIQETEWISWKNTPIILNKYLHTIKKGDIIGPIQDYNGINIIVITDTKDKTFKLPITQVSIKNISLQNPCKNSNNTIEKLLKIKNYFENNMTALNKTTKKNLEYLPFMNYQEHIEDKDLNEFSPEIKKILLSLKPNEISSPIYTDNKWCLIQLKHLSTISQSTILHERAYLHLLNKKFDEIMNSWITELQSKSYIKVIN